MDEDRIGLVLVRVAELRGKITNCVHKAATSGKKEDGESLSKDSKVGLDAQEQEAEEDDDEEAAESLLNIREALESLEAQLSSLQALQQQQLYEKEAALAEIRYSQRKLLEKLKDYRGEELEVIREAIAFAGEAVEDNNDLLLPPYPSRPLHSVMSDNDYLSQFPSARKKTQNGVVSGETKNAPAKGFLESDTDQLQPEPGRPLSRVKGFIGAVAKSALTIVGVFSVLSLAGYEPRLRKSDKQFKLLHLFQQHQSGDGGITVECPPGKVPVLENGETRCLVKERVEIPFESGVATPDVNYGCG
ncbi:plastid division protein PDV2-like [Coffea eugenioides]|uniref:plastid division protein PDV2-like n=1 Tax=Coffea eugenioides TaxID=49369 RepID=UPI000F6156F6|nr:plastid division protein PDV2-like [Coffea eugenioides]